VRRVLIADPNTPFATVVAEALQSMGGYKVTLAASGPEALKACAELQPTLAVVDVDLPECNPFALIGHMREAVPSLPVVLLPYSREDVPAGLNVQGVLIKPFFLPDLPEIINNILGGPADLELEPEPPPKPVVIDETNSRLLEGHVEALSHAVRNEPVLLSSGTNVISMCPRLGQTSAAALAEVVAKAWKTRGNGSEVIRFEGNSENTRYLLYSVEVIGDLVLSVAIRVRIPLPTVRKLLRDTAAELAALVTE
jgi:CheY-like chemotaxis protein